MRDGAAVVFESVAGPHNNRNWWRSSDVDKSKEMRNEMHSHSATTVHSVEKLVTEVTLDMQFFWVSLKFQEFVLICSDLQFGKDFLFGLFHI